ncbi:hypothetical protein RRF57_009102 [Xylaria bambusicola]|uniref:Uncharacterized protein n=1 Tax=Xylaria bambusicola TaxID=326684 RepID=A0AAN7UP58_9PEZI
MAPNSSCVTEAAQSSPTPPRMPQKDSKKNGKKSHNKFTPVNSVMLQRWIEETITDGPYYAIASFTRSETSNAQQSSKSGKC